MASQAVPRKGALSEAERRQLYVGLQVKARGGDAVATGALRLIYQNPAIRERVGDLARQAATQWMATASGGDAALEEVYEEKLEALAAELRGPVPTPMERLLADRAALCWLQLHHVERRCAEALHGGPGGKPASFATIQEYQKWLDRAHRRYLSALKTLATVRRLLVPAVQVNIADKQVNVASASAPLPSA